MGANVQNESYMQVCLGTETEFCSQVNVCARQACVCSNPSSEQLRMMYLLNHIFSIQNTPATFVIVLQAR